MGPSDLLLYLAVTLERLGIPYLVTGSTAITAYGEHRFTNDIDVVFDLAPEKVDAFCQAFPGPEYLCFPPAVAEAVRTRFQFHILRPTFGLKINVMIASDSEFDRSRLRRGVYLRPAGDQAVCFASPEDVIVKKLEYYREGGSDKHLRDIVGVLKVRGEKVDRTYIAAWTDRLGLAAQWRAALDREATAL